VDNHHNSGNIMAARLFRSEHKFKLPENRQLDPYSDRYRRHTPNIEPAWDSMNLSRYNN
jgi:hypothetical protein